MSSNINPVFGTYKYTGSFRFWVQKVLPLVYDDSLSYYELLCKVVQYLNDVIANVDTLNEDVEALREAFLELQEYVNNYFDNLDVQEEINNKLNEMAKDGFFDDLLDKYLSATKLVRRVYTSYFAQVYPEASLNTDYGSEGICVIERNGDKFICCSFIKGANESDTSIVIYNLETGMLVNRKLGLPLGHANSLTYCADTDRIYVACGGGTSLKNYIIELDFNLNITNQIMMSDGDLPYGICYNEFFYVLVSGNRIKKFNTSFELIETVNFESTNQTTYQGLVGDNNYLYLPTGNAYSSYDGSNIITQAIDVYFKDGTFKERILIDSIFEVEEFDFIDSGEIVIGCNTGSACLILKGGLYNSPKLYNSINNYYLYKEKIASRTTTIYIDRTYFGFFMDGSENYPLSNIYWVEPLIFNGADNTEIILLSDILDQNINIKESINKIVIRGNNHTVAGVYLGNNYRVSIYDLVINNRNTTESALLSIHNTKYVYINGITFEDFVADYCIHNVSSFLTLINCNINITANLYLISITEGAYINASNVTETVNGKYLINSANSKFAASAVTDNLLGSGVENADNVKLLRRLSRGTSINLNNVKRSCVIEFTTGVQPTNGPSLSSGEWILSCEMDCTKTTYASQTCLVYNNSSARVLKKYTRFYNGNSFTNWFLVTTFE